MRGVLRWKVAQSFEINWWQRYLKKKDSKQYAEWKRNYWNNLLSLITDVVQPKEGDKILDAGCGPAGIFMVTDQFYPVAVDPLLDEYEHKLHHFKKSFYPTVNFVSQPLEEFLSPEKFDFIFCMNAINHVADLELSFDKIVGLAKPNGKIIITIDAHNFSFFKNLFRIIPGDVLHPHQFNLKEYETMLSLRNCKIEKRIKLKHEFFFDHYLLVARKNQK